jgi:hypothetical protein
VKIPELESLPLPERRRFLKLMGAALAGPMIDQAIRFAAHDLVGSTAYAQSVEDRLPTYFIEIDMRDQVDYGHVFVAPALAGAANQRRGTRGNQLALFYTQEELRAHDNRIFLTDDSKILEPHLDTVAMIDCCELSQGEIHGHEAANPLRSPGRSYNQTDGKLRMWDNDPISNFPQGCEAFYSSTPTPATLHNYHSRQLEPTLKNGFAFKGISRSIHTVYHFGAGLPGAELDRLRSKESLFEYYPDRVEDLSILPRAEDASLLATILGKIDRRFLAERRRHPKSVIDQHTANLAEAKGLLHSGATRTVSLPLTPEETAFWSEGVPEQQCDRGSVKAEIWEQVAFAEKVITSGLGRSIALEFDYVDIHDERTEFQMRTYAKQATYPLARLIDRLKAAGLYDRTLIAIYSADGGRSPAAGTSGNVGKNAVILAGGMIKGGYYGDVTIQGDDGDGHRYGYRAPDPVTGTPGPIEEGNGNRLAGSAIWRTVMKALEVPDALCNQFADVAGVQPLSWLLRT